MSGVGKRIGDELYVHVSAVDGLTDLRQRTVIREAIALLPPPVASLVNVVKLNTRSNRVSLLEYTAFDEDAFPALANSWTGSNASAGFTQRSYAESLNPPILHRKELLVHEDHPDRAKWCALTAETESLGLFDDTRIIGFRMNWERLVAAKGYQLQCGEFVPLANAIDGGDQSGSPSAEEVVYRHRTALSRNAISAPVQLLLRHGLLTHETSFFDYGCGRGDDVVALKSEGFPAAGWDPHYAADRQRISADVVNVGFVINVIEDPAERVEVLHRAFELAQRVMSVGVMLYGPDVPGRPYRDGHITSRGTFQKYFKQSELKDYLDHVLGQDAMLVGPGVAIVFKDKAWEQRFLVGRYRRAGVSARLLAARPRPTTPRLDRSVARRAELRAEPEQPHPLLESLWRLSLDLGRVPEALEVPFLAEIDQGLGGLQRAVRKMSMAFEPKLLDEARAVRTEDLRLYFAMQQFGRRPRYRQLEMRLQRDIKAFFGDYASAQAAGLALLTQAADSLALGQACHDAAVQGLGWLEGDHLQFHVSLVERMPAVLRAFVSCGLLIYGDLSAVDLVKVHSSSGKLTLMQFEGFAVSPLPLMNRRVKVNVRRADCDVFEYGQAYPKPPLYWKSRFMHEEMPGYEEQVAFDEALEGAGVLGDSEYGASAEELSEALARRRLEIAGMRLRGSTSVPDIDARCGSRFTYRELIECGETQARLGLANIPRNPETFNALNDLAIKLLDPLVEYFGSIQLTYGFCSLELGRHIKARVAPALDQHAAHELNRRGEPICARGGAACDFLVEDEDMREVAGWIIANLPFDRLYFYGSRRPIHLSYAASELREAIEMRAGPSGRLVPRRYGL
ncbi:MAG: DNA phosphorothioation-associated putative methyltransferase [Rubrivivax sp.]|nr:DNA phosphorothioation-associated putative methyltransferase [Rubrivivax sp.]